MSNLIGVPNMRRSTLSGGLRCECCLKMMSSGSGVGGSQVR